MIDWHPTTGPSPSLLLRADIHDESGALDRIVHDIAWQLFPERSPAVSESASAVGCSVHPLSLSSSSSSSASLAADRLFAQALLLVCKFAAEPASWRWRWTETSETARRREHAHQHVLLPLMAAAPAFFHRTAGGANECSGIGGNDGSTLADDGSGEGAALLLRRFVFPCVLPAALNASPLAAAAGDFGDWRLWPESVVSEHGPSPASSASSVSDAHSTGFDPTSSVTAARSSTATGGASLLDLSAVLFRHYSALLRIELGSLLVDLWLPMLAASACPAAHRVELLGALGTVLVSRGWDQQ